MKVKRGIPNYNKLRSDGQGGFISGGYNWNCIKCNKSFVSRKSALIHYEQEHICEHKEIKELGGFYRKKVKCCKKCGKIF